MDEDKNGLQSLIQQGFIEAALGAVLAKDKEEGAVAGALIGAAILATWKASEMARNSKIPVYVEENGNLNEITPDGERRFIKRIEKPNRRFPDSFKLK